MNIVFISNPDFFGDQKRPEFSSMPRFTNMLANGMLQRGHSVSVWKPEERFFGMAKKGTIKKWLGYIDLYIMFPRALKRKIKTCSPDTLFVFTDQAQGPWVPFLAGRKHVVHCHDFLAQLSALGKIDEWTTGWAGRQYQRYIRRGLTRGRHFISISEHTNGSLLELLSREPHSADIVYNGLDALYSVSDPALSRAKLGQIIQVNLSPGYLLHVGNNQWYKNRTGVVEIYNEWRLNNSQSLPLLLAGSPGSPELMDLIQRSPFRSEIHIIEGLSDENIRIAYSGASAFLFPSLAEGFGWPIAEAMACGCPVILTDKAPMTEVAGDAGFLIPKRTAVNAGDWSRECAAVVRKVINLGEAERRNVVELGLRNAKRFDSQLALDQIENIYYKIQTSARLSPVA